MEKEYKFHELCPYIREVGLQRRDSWKNMPRKIYDHQFLYCFTGTANITIDGKYYKIRSGDLVTIPPNKPHIFWVDDIMSGELYWCHFDFFYRPDCEWLFDFYNNMEKYVTLFESELQFKEHLREVPVFEGGYSLPEFISIKNSDAIEYLFRMMYKAFMRGDRYWQLSAKISFIEIFELILMQTNNDKTDMSNKLYIVDQIKTYIDKNYYKKLTVNEICENTWLNPEYASKIFKKETGVKLVEFLNKFRIEKAKKLMLDSDLSIADIADMVGFSNENYFCTVTKKLEGQTPAKLRLSLLNLLSENN
ncbi:MAG: AraC family transcriptional regulator [Oscillospiraceae bacterium]